MSNLLRMHHYTADNDGLHWWPRTSIAMAGGALCTRARRIRVGVAGGATCDDNGDFE